MHKQIVYIILGGIVLSGLSVSQTTQDIEKLRKQYQEALTRSRQLEAVTMPTDIYGTGLPAPAVVTPKIVEPEPVKELRHFGYDFFTRRDTIPFWENLPAPADYQLGPGDEIVISLWGETQLRSTYTISRDGKVYIDKVGQLFLKGRTLSEARSYLKGQFAQVYSTLKDPRPSTYMDVSVGGLKSINVNFVGEVKLPGVHAVHPFSTVITGLVQIGGVDTTGSLRDIQIIRGGKITSQVDLYTFLQKGDVSPDIRLFDQDIVFIPVRGSTITIKGQLNRPGIYEALPGESLQAMIDYAGSLKANASSLLELRRIIPLVSRNSDDDAVQIKYLDIAGLNPIPAQDGDEIIVGEILPVSREVMIHGQVKKPGKYGFEEGLTLLDVLAMAGGIEDSSFWKTVYEEEAQIVRRSEESKYSQVIDVDLRSLVNGNSAANVQLENGDEIVIHRNPYYEKSQNVQIIGEVLIPGVYSITQDEESLNDIIRRAGSFTSRAFKEGIVIHRDTLQVVWEDLNVKVVDRDSIIVPQRPGVVLVTGEIYNSGYISHRPGRSLNSYIQAAGGYTPNANHRDVLIIYANGDVKAKGFLFSPIVAEGAIIQVNPKEEREPINMTQFATNWAQIISSLATIYLIVK